MNDEDAMRLANESGQNFVAKFFKRRGLFVHDYEAAYYRQVKRNDMLMVRVENLQKEIERQKSAYDKFLREMDPHWHGWVRIELQQLMGDMINLFIALRPMFGCENVKYGIGNLSAGFAPDGKSQLDMSDPDVQNIREAAEIMHKIMTYMDWEDD